MKKDIEAKLLKQRLNETVKDILILVIVAGIGFVFVFGCMYCSELLAKYT